MGDLFTKEEENKLGVGDIIFFVLCIVLLLVLIPFYASLFTLIRLSLTADVGTDIYICVLALIISFVIMGIGFKFKNLITKFTALLLIAVFTLMPFREYYSKKNLFTETLGDYKFKGITVVRPEACGSEQKMQEEIVNNAKEAFGMEWDFAVESRPMPDENASFKEKFKCMPSKTHLSYNLTYKDAYGNTRTIEHTSDKEYNELLKGSSFSIAVGKLLELLNENKFNRSQYEFYLITSQPKPIVLNRRALVTENVKLLLPTEITLENFAQDPRLIIEINFGVVPKAETVHPFLDTLKDLSNYPLNMIIKYRQETEYYVKGELVNGSYEDFLQKLRKSL